MARATGLDNNIRLILWEVCLIRSTAAESLFELIDSLFVRDRISRECLVSICTDGAANMGKLGNLIEARFRLSIVKIHCFSHRLNLIIDGSVSFAP